MSRGQVIPELQLPTCAQVRPEPQRRGFIPPFPPCTFGLRHDGTYQQACLALPGISTCGGGCAIESCITARAVKTSQLLLSQDTKTTMYVSRAGGTREGRRAHRTFDAKFSTSQG